MNIDLDFNGNKGFRLLSIYERLNKGEILNKEKLSSEYSVSLKTIQRDIDDLRAYLCEMHSDSEVYIKYNKSKQGYYLVTLNREWLSNQEVLAVSKILLESRAFKKEELRSLIDKLLSQVLPEDKKKVDTIIRNELFNYVPLSHQKSLFEPIWKISNFINNQEIIKFTYTRQDDVTKERIAKPVSIMFSEFYFYLIAYLVDSEHDFPIIFRVDRIENLSGTNQKFDIPYLQKFEDGEFRKRIQFMYSGELVRVVFKFNGDNLESVLDRLPTAKIISKENNSSIIQAEIFGEGVKRWFLSQKSGIEVISPEKFRNEIKSEIEKMYNLYK